MPLLIRIPQLLVPLLLTPTKEIHPIPRKPIRQPKHIPQQIVQKRHRQIIRLLRLEKVVPFSVKLVFIWVFVFDESLVEIRNGLGV